MTPTLSDRFHSALMPYLGPHSSLHFFWKGRVALYVILKALGIGPGDEVIVPAYTCVVVPNAILYTGATPIYADINPTTYCCDAVEIERHITPKTRAIICQNTYGLSWEVDQIADMGKRYGIATIEDCTHGFGGTYKGRHNGSFCDASFFSSQWNKPFSTGLGGYLQVNRSELLRNIESQKAASPDLRQVIELWIQLFLNRTLLTPSNYWRIRSLYRGLSRLNLITGSSQGNELTTIRMPDRFLCGMSRVQFRAGITALSTFDRLRDQRRTQALLIHETLRRMGKTHVPDEVLADHGFLLYPIQTSDRADLFESAERERIQLTDWFISPLHPVDHNFEQWQFDPNATPNATRLAATTFGIPLQSSPERIIQFLTTHRERLQ